MCRAETANEPKKPTISAASQKAVLILSTNELSNKPLTVTFDGRFHKTFRIVSVEKPLRFSLRTVQLQSQQFTLYMTSLGYNIYYKACIYIF